MSQRVYGVSRQTITDTPQEQHLEELAFMGYTVLEAILTSHELEIARLKLDEVYRQQEQEFGQEYLIAINELNLARCPLAYDEFFLHLATQEQIISIAQ